MAQPSGTIASFGFEDQLGRSFTARREQREQQWYWYAYRKRGKQMRKVYLGKTDQLEPARLQAAARELASLPPDIQHTRPPAGRPRAEQIGDGFLRSVKLRIPIPPATCFNGRAWSSCFAARFSGRPRL